jgi:outer membrane protein OmpA-like peptidoglycan-associated protein
MSGRLRAIIYVMLFGALVGFTTQPVAAQESFVTRPRTVTKATSLRTIPNGEKVEIVGNVIRVQGDTFSVSDMQGAETVVVLAPSTRIETHRRGIFRGAATRDKASLLIGLKVNVEGHGNPDGQLIAKWVRFHDSDFRGETQVDTRAIPIEAEQVRQAGQLDETTLVAITARKNAKAAQDSADKAQNTADLAQLNAATAQNTAVGAHTKIAAIDDFEPAIALTVTFKAGSAILTADDKLRLDEFAAKTVGVKGFILEISGFASREGDPEYNHRLSARRAEAVMDYLIGVGNVPIRRIIVPYSGGTMNPIADNTTREGRKMNRRTEVKMLVSKGLAAKEQDTAAAR